MREAAKHIDDEVKWFLTRARELTIAECEGDVALYESVRSICLLVAGVLEYRFKYLMVVPWTFVHADTPSGARAFIEEVESLPSTQHDALTVLLYETHKDDLHVVRDGGEVSQALADAVSEYNDSPVDESPGEGYHRSTHYARTRASNAKSPYLKQSVRCKSNIKLIRRFLSKGPQGRRVVRYEWRFWSRVLQVKPRNLWWRKKMGRDSVFRRIYRMDPMAEHDWSQICAPLRAPGQGPGPKPTPEPGSTKDTDALRIDFMTSVIAQLQWYSVDLTKAAMDESGVPIEIVQREYFQVLARVTSQSRPHLMPTIHSHRDTMMRARLALHTQSATVKPGAVDPDDGVVLFEDNDPAWVSWAELGPWVEVRGSLQHYRRVVGSLDHPGCVVAHDPVVATSPFAVTDLRCPAILMIKELHRRGWRPSKCRVLHDTAEIGEMDSREATKMKAYYVMLMEIPRCIGLSTRGIPSDQPIAYYKLLLNGVSVDWGLGDRAYQALMKGAKDVAPDPEPIMEGSSDEEIIQNANY